MLCLDEGSVARLYERHTTCAQITTFEYVKGSYSIYCGRKCVLLVEMSTMCMEKCGQFIAVNYISWVSPESFSFSNGALPQLKMSGLYVKLCYVNKLIQRCTYKVRGR